MIKTILIVLLFVLLCQLLIKSKSSFREGFTDSNDKFVYKNEDLYDDFYVGIYDDLVYNRRKNDFEVGEIMKYVTDGSVLDIGSGTGHHVKQLHEKGLDCVGLDSSKSMIKKAKIKFPDQKFIYADALKTMTFQPNSFDLVTMLYFTVYYIKDKGSYLKMWLYG